MKGIKGMQEMEVGMQGIGVQMRKIGVKIREIQGIGLGMKG